MFKVFLHYNETSHVSRVYVSIVLNNNLNKLYRNINPELVINKTLIVHARFGKAGDHRSMVEPFRPMVDGVEFPKQPLDMFQDGDWHTNIDVIIGTNRQELGIISAKFQDRKITENLYIV